MSDLLEIEQLQVGAVYRVEFEDCCVAGWFESRFVDLERDETGYVLGARFEHAYLNDGGGAWTIAEVAS